MPHCNDQFLCIFSGKNKPKLFRSQNNTVLYPRFLVKHYQIYRNANDMYNLNSFLFGEVNLITAQTPEPSHTRTSCPTSHGPWL